MRSAIDADGERIGDRRPGESMDGRPLEGEGEAIWSNLKEQRAMSDCRGRRGSFLLGGW